MLVIDAGVEHLRLRQMGPSGAISDELIPNHGDLRQVFRDRGLLDWPGWRPRASPVVTGKLAATVRDVLGGGRIIPPAEAFWRAAWRLVGELDTRIQSLALVDLSASGYLLVGVDRAGRLAHELLVVNPRCGAGSGINLDRVLQKLDVPRLQVDSLLRAYAGEAGRERRAAIATRADRCGVFASSATVSDKNQGIPLHVALATTLKSEVLKACRKLPAGFDAVCFCGRIFRWQFAREVAEDFARAQGAATVIFDPDNDAAMDALAALSLEAPAAPDVPPPDLPAASVEEFAGFRDIKRRYEDGGLYLRLPADPLPPVSAADLATRPVVVGLDIGSTMAKAVVADADDGRELFRSTASNAGDTVETVKRLLRDLVSSGVTALTVRGIGITGSARYQVHQALARLYPALADRLIVLVENYAHARGSIDEARRHVDQLAGRGVDVNRDLCVLVDIGGEDTKISTIALDRAELYANAMNLKCSAGTGSLMDTLAALFGLPDVGEACRQAFEAPRSFAINATCAVFLMENARTLQARGVPRDELLASANWAIVENMARTLWGQIDLPKRAVVLLHGQTMLSEPLPLAVTDRLQAYLGAPMYALVPANPGHRACLGLVRTLVRASPAGAVKVALEVFIDSGFEKRVIECRGAACGDRAARCNRTALSCAGADGRRFTFTLGGCTAINELFSRRGGPAPTVTRDAYKEIWDFIAAAHPKSDDPNRLVIPRSLCVSEWGFLFARMFERLGIPVHVDDVRETDLITAQGLFQVDACAPHMGVVGQLQRLAAEPHGVIVAPQIESLPTTCGALGQTCTVNQGGMATGRGLAEAVHPDARIHLFSVRLAVLEAGALADQLGSGLRAVFARYGVAPSAETLQAAIAGAIDDHRALRAAAADLAADLVEEARADGRQVAVVVGREYVLAPGLYDSSVRRLLKDRRMAAIPSYVLEIEPDPEFEAMYWRNPHVILTMLKAIAARSLHTRLKHPRLAAQFKEIETEAASGTLLPVVQVSTFSCGPDSVSAHLVSEIMRRRPFLLLQSDAVLKELAHLENRVNTYMKQLELGLHATLAIDDGPPIEIARLADARSQTPVDPARDVIYLPTMHDNRCLTSVFRAAGLACIDNFDEARALAAIVREGRRHVGDAVCAPLAAVYGDLLAAVEDFRRRRARQDPYVAGKRRLLYFDNQGTGPCRQGQYADMHAFMAQRALGAGRADRPGAPIQADAVLQLLVGHEAHGFDVGLPEWALYRCYQGVVAQSVLQGLRFAGGARCCDAEEYARFQDAHRALKGEICAALESFTGPGACGRIAIDATRSVPAANAAAMAAAFRLDARDLVRPLRRFARRWIAGRSLAPGHLRLHASGEVYMRVAQADDLFERLIRLIGHRRFSLTLSPLWSYLEYLPEYDVECRRERLATLGETLARQADSKRWRDLDSERRVERRALQRSRRVGLLLRHVIARPLYRAAGLELPPTPRRMLEEARAVLPTLRPHGELALYIGEALLELRAGADLFLSLAPSGCMVATMGEVLTPRLGQVAGGKAGRIQSLFSADGDIDEEALAIALLKARGGQGLEPGAPSTKAPPVPRRHAYPDRDDLLTTTASDTSSTIPVH